jgi:hypothetical protein
MRKARNVWSRTEIRTVFWWRNPSGKHTVEEQGGVGRITLKIIQNKSGWKILCWIGFALVRKQWHAAVKSVVRLTDSQMW